MLNISVPHVGGIRSLATFQIVPIKQKSISDSRGSCRNPLTLRCAELIAIQFLLSVSRDGCIYIIRKHLSRVFVIEFGKSVSLQWKHLHMLIRNTLYAIYNVTHVHTHTCMEVLLAVQRDLSPVFE